MGDKKTLFSIKFEMETFRILEIDIFRHRNDVFSIQMASQTLSFFIDQCFKISNFLRRAAKHGCPPFKVGTEGGFYNTECLA